MEETFIRQLVASTKCVVCGQHYKADNISVLGHQEDLWLLRVLCSGCHTQFLVAAAVKEGRKPQVITDLTEAELDKFGNADELTADDVLDMHDFLKHFNGDFSRLFRQKES